jgi:hypothetical protein
MTKQQDTIDKAYANVPKHLPNEENIWDWIPTRGIKYFYLTLWRKLFR